MTLWQSYTLKVCIHACVCIYILDYSDKCNLCVIFICIGVEVTLNGDSHIHFRSQAVLLACTCDLPARAQLTNMVLIMHACVALIKASIFLKIHIISIMSTVILNLITTFLRSSS